MCETWQHPKLGTFEWEPSSWFPVESESGISIEFVCDDEIEEPQPPSQEHVQLICSILDTIDELWQEVAIALCDDLSEKGPDTGMWWRRDTEDVR
ncbi:MAG: hypothetical protein ACI9DF_004529 [Verrucomicrobiales bacterium]|jgi:hypothetical protein